MTDARQMPASDEIFILTKITFLCSNNFAFNQEYVKIYRSLADIGKEWKITNYDCLPYLDLVPNKTGYIVKRNTGKIPIQTNNEILNRINFFIKNYDIWRVDADNPDAYSNHVSSRLVREYYHIYDTLDDDDAEELDTEIKTNTRNMKKTFEQEFANQKKTAPIYHYLLYSHPYSPSTHRAKNMTGTPPVILQPIKMYKTKAEICEEWGITNQILNDKFTIIDLVPAIEPPCESGYREFVRFKGRDSWAFENLPDENTYYGDKLISTTDKWETYANTFNKLFTIKRFDMNYVMHLNQNERMAIHDTLYEHLSHPIDMTYLKENFHVEREIEEKKR